MELLSDFILFDYANKYSREHDSIAPAIDFEITDDMYADFVAYVNTLEDFKYVTNSEKSLEKLKKIAEREDYLDDINAELEALEAKLMHNKNEDLQNHQDEISEMLKLEIASRYYYQKGRIIANLQSDPEVEKAIELINDTKSYSGILDGTVTKASLK